MSEKKADLLLMITAIFWGFGYIGVDILLENNLAPLVIVGLRFLIASVVILIIFRSQMKIVKSEFTSYLLVGLALFLGFFFQTIAMNYTTTTNVSFITNVNIVFVPIIGFFLYKQKMTFKHLLAIILTLSGVWVLTGGIKHIDLGDTLTFIGAFFFGLHIVLINHFSKNVNIFRLVFGQMITTAILALVLAFIRNEPIVSQAVSSIPTLLFVGLFPTALCFFLQNYGLKYTDENKGSIILGTESLWGAVFAIIFLHDPFNWHIIISAVLMMSAILIDNLSLLKQK